MLMAAIALAIIAAVVEYFWPITEPWRKIVIIGIVILLVVGIIGLIFPGLLPVRLGWY